MNRKSLFGKKLLSGLVMGSLILTPAGTPVSIMAVGDEPVAEVNNLAPNEDPSNRSVVSSISFRSVSYKTEGSVNYNIPNCMFIYFVNGNTENYIVTYKHGNEEGKEANNQLDKTVSNRNFFAWSIPQEELKSGEWTVQVYSKKDDNRKGDLVATKKVTLYELEFNAEDGTFDETNKTKNPGTLSEDKKTYTTFATNGEYYFQYLSLKVNAPKANEGESFLYWSEATGDEAKSKSVASKEFNHQGTDKLTLHAIYGVASTYDYAITKQGEDNDLSGYTNTEYSIGQVPYGSEKSIVLDLKYKGNTNSIISFRVEGEFDPRVKKGTEDITNTFISLEKDQNYTIEITPGKTMSTGIHRGSVTMKSSGDSGVKTFKYSIEIIPQDVKVTINSPQSKEYGQKLNSSSIDYSVTGINAEEKDNLGLSFICNGFTGGADVGSYPISIETTNKNYSVQLEGSPTIEVKQSEPIVTVSYSTYEVGDTLKDREVVFVSAKNKYNNTDVVGTVDWADQDKNTKFTKEGSYQASWVFKPTETKNYTEKSEMVSISVSAGLDPDLQLADSNVLESVYNGQPKPVSFISKNGSSGTITVKYYKDSDHSNALEGAPKEAGTYFVEAEIEPYRTGNQNYSGDKAQATLVIQQKELSILSYSVEGKTYDGNNTVAPECIHYSLSGVVSGDSPKASVIGTYESKDIGSRNVTLVFGELTGNGSSNYSLPANVIKHTTSMITPRDITLSVREGENLTKKYGVDFPLSASLFEAENMALDETPAEVLPNLIFQSEGVAPEAVVNTSSGYGITCSGPSGNYRVNSDVKGSIKVEKAHAKLKENSIITGFAYKDGNLSDVTINGVFENQYNSNFIVKGTLKWTENQHENKFKDEEKATHEAVRNWTFTPQDSNYNSEPITGTATIKLIDAVPIKIDAKNQIETYDGAVKEYKQENYSFTPNTSSSTLIYKEHLDSSSGQDHTGGEEEYIPEEWSQNPPKEAGTYDVRILAFASGVDSSLEENYADSYTTVHLIIEPAEITTDNLTSYHGVEGTELSQLLPEEGIKGVDGKTTVNGRFSWENPNQKINALTGEYKWTFISEDKNYKDASGTATVTMDKDPRTISFEVYNLPDLYDDYALLSVPEKGSKNSLKSGESITFYTDSSCEDPCGIYQYTESDAGQKVVVNLDDDGLTKESNYIYAKISGLNSETSSYKYEAETEPSITDQSVTLGSNVLLSLENENIVPGSCAWTVQENGVLSIPEGTSLNEQKLVLDTTRIGEATVSITLEYNHPDKIKHPNETIKVSKTITITVSEASKPSGPTSGGNGGGAGGGSGTSGGSSGNQGSTGDQEQGDDPTTEEPGTQEPTAPTVTETTKTNGTKEKVTTDSEGNKETETVDTAGTTAKVSEDKNGFKEASINVSKQAVDSSAATKTAVSIDIPPIPADAQDEHVAITITIPEGTPEETTLSIPVVNGNPGSVVMIEENGKLVPVLESYVDKEGNLHVPLSSSAKIVIKDNSKAFKDVTGSKNEYPANNIAFLSARGIMTGKGETGDYFDPLGQITRGQLALMMYRYSGQPDVSNAPLPTGVPADEYYASAARWAVANGIMGQGGSLFNGNNPLTREQLALILYRQSNVDHIDLTKLDAYGDKNLISSADAANAVAWSVEQGIMGKGAKNLRPEEDSSRQELAAMVARWIQPEMAK